MNTSIIGFVLSIIIIGFSGSLAVENQEIFLNLLSVLIVFGGTLSVSIMTYGLRNLFTISLKFFRTFTTNKYRNEEMVREIIDYIENHDVSNKSQLYIPEEGHPFFSDGLKLIQNNFSSKQIQEIMKTSILNRLETYHEEIAMLKNIGKYPPALGMIGTIIGLVSVLQSLGKVDNIETLGPSMAVALITTLYGLFLSNYFINPFADNLSLKSDQDIHIRKIILKAILLINENEDSIMIKESLKVYLSIKHQEEISAEYTSTSNKSEKMAA